MSHKRLMTCILLLIVGGIACWYFPLFHLRPLNAEKKDSSGQAAMPEKLGPADPIIFVQEFWDGPLRSGAIGTEVTQLWNSLDADKTTVRSLFGRQAGLGGPWYFCIRGHGTVEKVEGKLAILKVADSSRRASLDLGLTVDNTIREAIGVKASEFANSQDLNAVSSELNRRVEQDVLSPNRLRLQPGAIVEFTGCTKIGRDSDFDPLCLIPIRLEVRSNQVLETKSNPVVDLGTSQ